MRCIVEVWNLNCKWKREHLLWHNMRWRKGLFLDLSAFDFLVLTIALVFDQMCAKSNTYFTKNLTLMVLHCKLPTNGKQLQTYSHIRSGVWTANLRGERRACFHYTTIVPGGSAFGLQNYFRDFFRQYLILDIRVKVWAPLGTTRLKQQRDMVPISCRTLKNQFSDGVSISRRPFRRVIRVVGWGSLLFQPQATPNNLTTSFSHNKMFLFFSTIFFFSKKAILGFSNCWGLLTPQKYKGGDFDHQSTRPVIYLLNGDELCRILPFNFCGLFLVYKKNSPK